MNNQSKGQLLKNFTVTFATSQVQLHSLETIAALAASFDADISGVFIEDADMLNAVRLPFTQELCRLTNTFKQTDSLAVERGLKIQAASVHRLFADTTNRLGARSSFRVLRQQTIRAVFELTQCTDVVLFSPRTQHKYCTNMLDLPVPKGLGSALYIRPILALADGSPSGWKALKLARRIAEYNQVPLHMIAIDATQAGLDKIVEQLHNESHDNLDQIQSLRDPTIVDILKAARVARPISLVLPVNLLGKSSTRLREFDEAIESPIVIVN